jgi:hypothetical protein
MHLSLDRAQVKYIPNIPKLEGYLTSGKLQKTIDRKYFTYGELWAMSSAP